VMAGRNHGCTATLPAVAGLTDAAVLTRLPDHPGTGDAEVVSLPIARAFIERWDPAGWVVPAFTSPLDAAVAARSLDAPPLAGRDGWHLQFGRELNATDDGPAMVERGRDDRDRTLLPVVDGRHLRPFGVATGQTRRAIPRTDALARLGDAAGFLHPRVCYRDVASRTNRVSLIAACLPAGVVSTHTVFCARRRLSPDDTWCLVGLLNSLVANFLVRLQMGMHLSAALMARLPVPRPAADSPAHAALAGLAQSLSRVDRVEDRAADYAELNAVAARLYGLDGPEFAHVVASFPLVPETLRADCLDRFTALTAAGLNAWPPSR
jgi:hypothetical protein